MGSPLGPSLANAFLCHFETVWLDSCPIEFKPVLYKRYVDDCFLLFRQKSHVSLFLDFLNRQHPNIEFTFELESGGVLSFLDTSISRAGGHFQTSLYRKPTFSGVYSHFDSFSPLCFKFGLIFTLLFRAYQICSSFGAFHDEVLKLKSILRKNGYPLSLIDSVVSKFLNKLYRPPTDSITTVPCKPVLIVIPFLGASSIHVRNRIQILCKRLLPQVSCRVVLKPSVRLTNFFLYKDGIPAALKSLVVYNFTCASCSSSYIGQTKRHIKTRVCEHAGISDRTGIEVKNPKDSAVFCHYPLTTGVCDRATMEEFRILCSASNSLELQVKESILISRNKPNLNRNIWSLPLLLLG